MKISTCGMLLLLMAVVIGGCATAPEQTDATAAPSPEAPAGNAAASAPARPPAAPAVTAVAPEAPANLTAARATAPATPAPPAAPRVIELAEGTQLEVVLLDSLSSATNKSGDQFTATLAAPLVVNGTTVIQKGTRLQGRIVDAQNSGRVNGKATMRLVLTGVVQNEKVVPIVTQALVAEAEATTGRDAKVIGGGTGVGAAIGAIAGGGKGAATGAIIGAAAGTGAVLATKGKEVEFPVESKLKFSLERAVDMPAAVKNPT